MQIWFGLSLLCQTTTLLGATQGVSILSVTGNEAVRFQVVRKLLHLDGPDVVDRVQTGGPRSPLRQERQ